MCSWGYMSGGKCPGFFLSCHLYGYTSFRNIYQAFPLPQRISVFIKEPNKLDVYIQYEFSIISERNKNRLNGKHSYVIQDAHNLYIHGCARYPTFPLSCGSRRVVLIGASDLQSALVTFTLGLV